MNRNKLFKTLKTDIDRINQALESNLSSHVQMISEVGRHILLSGGKRIRPLLFLLSARMCGCQEDHLPDISTVFEYLHAATLLHDDVVDAATVRRGLSSANMIWGNQAVILVGDFLLSKALGIAVSTNRIRIMQVLAQTTIQMAEGEILQLIHIGNLDKTEADYFEVITRKTAILMSAACQIGAILGGVPPAQESALRDFGLNLGITFQIVDDILDYTGNIEELGKPVGNDLKEGKITLPLIHALSHAQAEDRQRLQELAKSTDRQEITRELRPILHQYGSLDHARQQAQHYTTRAQEFLKIFPPSREKTIFMEITNYLVERTF
ncbi:MAG: polyprenyl synthetase family protein [Deltaproteobacteria bacterium]|nr:polyprenyl synthetase family protein [Deltaproteobacteria bacterium]MBW1952237.1 polyprenyl synthetase family protein [Deltaproteobacteria bacterium]MBW1985835.1 polyprenyl synthetase family protein [Deltaproteobacteria bacterium]MBW2133847.1 polyprenyl synthetase family protein [Deltaproteobacteria bacterium]